ncbi:MAG: hypothetical protein DRP66_00860 [Planctomycetota bacterium]|nr:MAG: hypothetical protein DRP66_00860 [Planctomycetota bacterium]
MDQNKEKIKLRFIVPLGLAILVLLGTCVITLRRLHNHHINHEVQKSLNKVSRLFRMELEEDAGLLEGILGFLHKDKNLRNAWLAGDRQSLLRYASPVFEEIRSKHNVTHFYFHGLDRVNFLRVHKPQKYGDYIDRFTMNQAAGSGKSAWGIELGPLGTFTLRFVYPWRINGKPAGYIELGEEIEHITPELAEVTGAELFFVINKSYLNRAGLEQGMEMLGRSSDWDRFSDFIIVDSTMETPPPVLCKEMQRRHVNHEKFLFEISTERDYLGGFVPLYDAGDNEVGEIIVLKDITSQQASLRSLSISLIWICSAVGVLLLVFFYLYTSRIEQRLEAGHQYLRDSNRRLESEIAEHMRAEEEILDLSRFPAENRDPVLRISREGVLLYANPASEELLRDWGCQVEEPVPEYWKEVSQDALEKNAEQRIEYNLADRTFSLLIAPVAGSGYVNLYGHDITDRKKAEEESFNAQQRLIEQQQHEAEHVEAELARIRRELVRSTRLAAIGQVSGSIAHDLRNPLGTVRNAAYLLNRHLPKDDPKLLDYTDIINQEVVKADQIITNLLEMVGTRPPRKHPVDLGRIVEEVEQSRKSEGVACRISVVPDPFVVQADEGQLRQVIDNILSNSVYAMGGQGGFFVEAGRDSDYDTVVLRDTGPGFAPEVRDRLFDALVTTKASGIGLGLTICRQIIEKHGGTIEADEHNQGGAVIRIRLPRG